MQKNGTGGKWANVSHDGVSDDRRPWTPLIPEASHRRYRPIIVIYSVLEGLKVSISS